MSKTAEAIARLVKGADGSFFITLTVSKNGGPFQAFKLEAVPTQVQLRIPKDDGSTLRVELAGAAPQVIVSDADGGELQIKLTEVETDLLKGFDPEAIDLQAMELLVKQDIPEAGTTEIFDLPDSLSVAIQRFPE